VSLRLKCGAVCRYCSIGKQYPKHQLFDALSLTTE
jgi:hypothetical protein